MRVAVLTSSRADYGIYLPLLKTLSADEHFELKIIAFGTHVSPFHGLTVAQIEKDGFEVAERLETMILGDTEEAVSNAMGNTIIKFSSLWQKLKDKVDLVFALGDRYEMFAAVAASVPFNIKIAHIHGGETTLGAIDNKFRHAITTMSLYHFTSTAEYAERVKQINQSTENVYNVGSLSLDNIGQMELLDKKAFREQWNIDLSIPTILTTFHPETVSVEKNSYYSDVLVEAFEALSEKYQIVITMPNADTMGALVREKFKVLIARNEKVIGIENFGTLGYFSCMKHCSFLLGNTSSGIIEAASFGKYVINLGDRQKGRSRSQNVIDVAIETSTVLAAIEKLAAAGLKYKGSNLYAGEKKASKQIVNVLRKTT